MKKANKLNTKSKLRKKLANPYSNIDWQKATKLFQNSTITSGKKKFPSIKELLPFIAAAGAIGLVFAFPGAAPAIGSFFLDDFGYDRWKMKKTLDQLARQKYVKIKENNNQTITVKITQNGMIRALTYKLESMKINKPKKWDRKWRVVIFDIPEKYRRVRDIFRMRLGQLGLHQLQESVYVLPYPCFDEVEFLRELYGIAFTVRYLLVEKIEDDDLLKDHYNL